MQEVPVDWRAVEATPEFRELVARRRRFVVPATVFFLAWYCGFVILCGYAEDFMGGEVVDGLTVGYLLALTQFVMVWTLGWAYLRYSARVLDPLRERVTQLATGHAMAQDPVRPGRAERRARAASVEAGR